MTTKQIKTLDIANYIENCAIENDYWIDKKQIAKKLEVSVEAIQDLIKESETIVINTEGKLTTRVLYKQKTSFFDKLINNIKNKID